MGFPRSVADEVLVRCRRHCCLCGKYAGRNIELHHIKQHADGGDDSIDNCIPLCFDCHADVKAYNPHHPKGRPFSDTELKGHRDNIYAKYSNVSTPINSEDKSNIEETPLFSTKKSNQFPSWGYSEIDKLLPIIPSRMILIAGYTGTRKSAYIYHIINANLALGQQIAFCCIKDHPFDIACDIIAEGAYVNPNSIKTGQLTEDELKRISISRMFVNSQNLAMLPRDKFKSADDILNVVNNSGADIVVIDDLNGLLLKDNDIESFMYQLKSAAAMHSVTVFVLYNLRPPKMRTDMRPLLDDFPSDNYYRLFDIVEFLFKPSVYYSDTFFDKNELELIIAKGASNNYVLRMHAPEQLPTVVAKENQH